MKRRIVTLLAIFFALQLSAQYSKTANDRVPKAGEFTLGTNMGYTPGWTDTDKADLARGNTTKNIPGAGANSLRAKLTDAFIEQWGINVRTSAFAYYKEQGFVDLTLFLEEPADEHRETQTYGTKGNSKMFKNMYEPIWDDNNGTPINEENYLAVFVYNLTQTYGPYIKFWEIWNEPDFTYGSNGWLPESNPESWWQRDPEPDELVNLLAPVEHYIRALRVCYEVIKSANENDFVCIGGVGYPSFLDAVLRNTDNPADGSQTSAFPLRGGAYFDCVSYHSYPMYKLSKWNNSTGAFDYYRHSDYAVGKTIDSKSNMQEVLDKYGYDGITYPKKAFIITETNVPNKATPQDKTENYIGSPEAQRNYLMKLIVEGQKNGLASMHTFALNDGSNAATSDDPYAHMGFYEDLSGKTIGQQKQYPSAIGCKTTMQLLGGKDYHAAQTEKMNLPDGVKGAAFRDKEGIYTYVLWAETKIDKSEWSKVNFRFGTGLAISSFEVYKWDYSRSKQKLTGQNAVDLFGEPVFIIPENSVPDLPTAVSETSTQLHIYPNPANDFICIDTGASKEIKSVYILDSGGKKWQLRKMAGDKEWGFPKGLKEGFYLLLVNFDNEQICHKLLLN